MRTTSEPAEAAVPARPLTPRDPRLGPWRAFLTAHALLSRRLDDDLRAEHQLTLAEYSALLQLAEAPGRRLRMNQLAESVFLSRSGVTRLIDRLVADGLVDRSHCATDGRGAEAVLTEAGLGRLRHASRTHLRGIETYFIGGVDADDLPIIQRSCAAIGDQVRNCDRLAPPAEAGTEPERRPA